MDDQHNHRKAKATKQPNSRACFVCGVENRRGLRLSFYEVGPDEINSTCIIPDHFQGYPGVAHGGVVAAVLDEAGGRALMIQHPTRFMVTAKLEVRYRLPIPTGKSLCLVGRAILDRGRRASAQSALFLPDGRVGAEAEMTLVEVPGGPSSPEELAAQGWKVYSE
jgi:acyl-coenzyme A thioesterase PaaI-like protein